MDIEQVLAKLDPHNTTKTCTVNHFSSFDPLTFPYLLISDFILTPSSNSHFPANWCYDQIYCSGISHSKGPCSLGRKHVSILPPFNPPIYPKLSDGEPFCILYDWNCIYSSESFHSLVVCLQRLWEEDGRDPFVSSLFSHSLLRHHTYEWCLIQVLSATQQQTARTSGPLRHVIPPVGISRDAYRWLCRRHCVNV